MINLSKCRLLLFIPFLLFSSFSSFVYANAVYQSANFVDELGDYSPLTEFTECSPSNHPLTLVRCVCNNRSNDTGAHATISVNQARNFNTGFNDGVMQWGVVTYTCDNDGDSPVHVVSTGQFCGGVVDYNLDGRPSPTDLHCVHNQGYVDAFIDTYSLTGGSGGDIDMTELIEVVNLNSEQMALLFYTVSALIAFMIGYKTGITR